MKLLNPVLLSLVALLISCETSETSFLDFYNVRTKLPPAAFSYTGKGDSHPINARIDQEGNIFGIGHNLRFHTKDYFNTVILSPDFGSIGFVDQGGKHVITALNYHGSLQISESSNYGATFDPKLSVPVFSGYDYAYFFLNKDSGWIVRESNGFEVIKVVNNTFQVISKIPSPPPGIYDSPHSIHFTDENRGILVLNKDFHGDIKSVFRTFDGGRTWSDPGLLNIQRNASNTQYGISAVVGYNDLVYAVANGERSGDYLYISTDGGKSWDFHHHDGMYQNMRSFQFLNDRVGFAIKSEDYYYHFDNSKVACTAKLYKTTDGGLHWSKVSNKLLYADQIYFLNERVGLAMSFGILQITQDGGASWQLLLYPVEVFE